jgi:hypothetical protein
LQGELLTLAPIYDYLMALNYKTEGEAIIIEDWAVQFLPVFDALLEESLEQARDIKFESVPTRVFTAEHLVAIMLQTGRMKDYARITKFIEEDVVDRRVLSDIFLRHGLTKKWQDFLTKFELTGTP